MWLADGVRAKHVTEREALGLDCCVFRPDPVGTARKGWCTLGKKITAAADIVDVCGSTDVGDVDYYLKRPRMQGDLHGFGPFLLAGSEILRLPQAQTHP